MKVCTNPKCLKGNKPQPLKNFTKRTGRSKKNGEQMYLSHCKKCCVSAQNERVKKKRAAIKIEIEKTQTEKFCIDCGAKVSRYAKRCVMCRQKQNGFKIKTKGIDPKYLVRGLISTHNRSCNISNEA